MLGPPSKSDISSIDSQYCRDVLSSVNCTRKRSMRNFFPKADDCCIDLLKKLIAFNPNERLTVEEALKHPYVS